jgi:hypothetical protein
MGHVELLHKMRSAYRVLVGRLEGRRDHLEELGVDGRIILNWSF